VCRPPSCSIAIIVPHRRIRSWNTDWWAVTFGAARRRLGGLRSRPVSFLAVPNVTAHPSAVSVPITVLLYDGPLLCDFNVAIKGLMVERIREKEYRQNSAVSYHWLQWCSHDFPLHSTLNLFVCNSSSFPSYTMRYAKSKVIIIYIYIYIYIHLYSPLSMVARE